MQICIDNKVQYIGTPM